MALNTARFLSLLFTALAFAPAMAHLLELPNKIHLSRDEYLTVQQIYRGWALLGVVIFGAIISTTIVIVKVRKQPKVFALTLVALLCLVTAQAVFWIFTFPANQRTDNWTVLPAEWESLRARWEYSHAAGAVFNLAALVSFIISTLVRNDQAV
jgi:hypothetical protein